MALPKFPYSAWWTTKSNGTLHADPECSHILSSYLVVPFTCPGDRDLLAEVKEAYQAGSYLDVGYNAVEADATYPERTRIVKGAVRLYRHCQFCT